MRTPNKSRSRNKNNRRNNNTGNSLNRVFDSAGPQGRVRGTPAQVIEKYQSLAHDSSLAGDRVATENFQQHAEHYIRLMNEAQRQVAERREAQEQAQERQAQDRQEKQGHQDKQQSAGENGPASAPVDMASAEQPGIAPVKETPQPDVIVDAAPASEEAGGLVETPEERSARPPRQRRPRTTKPAPKGKKDTGESAGAAE